MSQPTPPAGSHQQHMHFTIVPCEQAIYFINIYALLSNADLYFLLSRNKSI